MKLTTKRNRRYFWRELFSYMIPIILIVGTIDVFVSFMRCSMHPERSAPCSVNWIFAAMYGVLLVIVIFLTIISSKKLKKIKKQIENEFVEAIDNHTKNQSDDVKETQPKKIIVKKEKNLSRKNYENENNYKKEK